MDLTKLYYHGLGHPALKDKTALEISLWYQEVPEASLDELVRILTPKDRQGFFAMVDFPHWYSDFCHKIDQNTTIKVFGLTNEQIDVSSLNLLSGIIKHQLTQHTMQKLIQDILSFNFSDILSDFLICLGADGRFLELTIFRLKIDTSPYPRWLSVGLEAPPTEQDCTTVFFN